jgi:hypothetical protein
MSEQFKDTTLSEQFKNTTLSEQFKDTTLCDVTIHVSLSKAQQVWPHTPLDMSKCMTATIQRYHIVGTNPQSSIKVVERGKSTTSTRIHDSSLSLLGIGTSIQSGGG